jgi:hypothetical protein
MNSSLRLMSSLRSGLLVTKSTYILHPHIAHLDERDFDGPRSRRTFGGVYSHKPDTLLTQSRLVVNNLQVGNLTELFDDLDRSNFTGMTRTEIKLLTDRLNHHRHFLLSHVQELRRQAAPYPRIIERGPAGMMMGPYPGHMYPISPQNFPHGPSMIDPQRAAQGVPSSPKPPHQTYNQFVENQRNLASRYGPRVPPNNVRNENRTMGAGAEARARGWSNDTARNGRTNNSWNNRNGRPYVPATPQPSPPRPMGSAEPIYVFTSQNTSPQNQQPSQRIFSDPVPVNVHNPNPQRAFSDSPAGPGTFDSIDATPLGRRASTNDAGSRPNYIPENMVSPQEQRTTRSARSTPRAPLINDARVLAAMEKQAGPGFGNKQSLARAAAVQPRPLAQAAADTVRPNIELQTTTGAGGPIHTYHYSSSPHRLSYSEQCNRSVFVGNAPYDLFVDHALKEFLSQCGEVDNIQYLPQRGHAFVA